MSFSAYTAPSPKKTSASAPTRSKAEGRSSSRSTRRIPLPPPPAEALSRSGYPKRRPNSESSAVSDAALVMPGTTGTPAASILLRLNVFWPMASIASGVGPTNVRPASRQDRAKTAFSERKP